MRAAPKAARKAKCEARVYSENHCKTKFSYENHTFFSSLLGLAGEYRGNTGFLPKLVRRRCLSGSPELDRGWHSMGTISGNAAGKPPPRGGHVRRAQLGSEIEHGAWEHSRTAPVPHNLGDATSFRIPWRVGPTSAGRKSAIVRRYPVAESGGIGQSKAAAMARNNSASDTRTWPSALTT
jgi:hypothetical protein